MKFVAVVVITTSPTLVDEIVVEVVVDDDCDDCLSYSFDRTTVGLVECMMHQ